MYLNGVSWRFAVFPAIQRYITLVLPQLVPRSIAWLATLFSLSSNLIPVSVSSGCFFYFLVGQAFGKVSRDIISR